MFLSGTLVHTKTDPSSITQNAFLKFVHSNFIQISVLPFLIFIVYMDVVVCSLICCMWIIGLKFVVLAISLVKMYLTKEVVEVFLFVCSMYHLRLKCHSFSVY